MDKDLLKEAYRIATNNFHRWWGLFASSFLLGVVALMVYGLLPDDRLRFLHYAWGILALEIILVTYWLIYTFWIPKHNQKCTGLVICIYADSNDAEQNLKRDFVDSIKKQFTNSEIGGVFKIHTIKNHLAPRFNNFESIYKLHKKVRGHIYIFGEVKKRKNGDEQYFLSLDGLVLHRPVPMQVSKELGKDFLATLPKGINFKDEFAFTGFQISADIVTKAVEYISGIAASISGNPFLATRLHNDLKNRIASSTNRLPGDQVILSKIDNLLSNEYAIISAFYLSKNDQAKTYENLKLSLELNPKCYQSLIVESITSFSWENDPKKSLSVLKKCHDVADPTWRYNEAFVHFWLAQYPSAWKQCEKIRKLNYSNEPDISRQVTEFNENLLRTMTDKPVLYFWLGFNYYFKQKNLPLALKSFETFIQKADNSMTSLTQKASSWLVDIKREGNWK
ncbi:MAG: hypothetical protein NUV64_01040 [Parcubacteria group bacterium]|nr:hypothetical protein [Parcubacteria group bacterium]